MPGPALPSSINRSGAVAPFVCHFSQGRIIQLAFLAAVMTALSYWCTTLPEPKAVIAGWAGLALFGIGTRDCPATRSFASRPGAGD